MSGFLAYILPVDGGPVDPGFGNRPIHHPGHPDHGLPSSPGHPSQPIHHPGHPDHGLPSGGYPGNRPPGSYPGRPANRPPGSYPGRPDNSLPSIPGLPDHELPPGQPVTVNPPPPPPAGHEADLVIGVWNNGEWTFTAYDTSQQPEPTPQ